jgi:biopolymer transport protein ExbB
MSNAQSKSSGSGFPRWLFNLIVIVVEWGIAFAIFSLVFGNPENFEGNNTENHPLQGNYLGIIYKGGIIVPFLMTCFMLVITFGIERGLTIARASGKKSNKVFVRELQAMVDRGQIDQAIAACDVQKGSLANVLKAGLLHYKDLSADNTLDKDQKILSLQKELEEATALELPMLSQNMVILSTIVSLGTLIGLIGTVLGMIRAFSALGNTSGGDSTALATGISEALINTAIGILSSTFAIIAYNFFSTTIDNLTYRIDEAGFSLVQSFAATQK